MPIGVEVEDFVARVEFINPSDATDRPWDFGIAFREQENGDHYRLTVASDGIMGVSRSVCRPISPVALSRR